MHRRVARSERERPSIRLFRFAQPPVVFQCNPEIVPRRVGVEAPGNRRAIGHHGEVRMPIAPKRRPEVVMGLGIRRIELDGATVGRHRSFRIPMCQARIAQIAPWGRMIGKEARHLLEEPRGFVGSAGLEGLDARGEERARIG